MRNFVWVIFLLTLGCDQFEEVEAKDVIGLRAENDLKSIPADNISTMKFIAYIPVNADTDKREIEFETSDGIFSDNKEKLLTKTAKDTFELAGKEYLSTSVSLKSGNIIKETVTISAKIAFYPAKVNVSFTEAPATSLKISSDVFGLTNSFDSETTLTALVKSETGFPSSGRQVEFLVFDADDNSQFTDLRFRSENLMVNSSGVASTIFTAGNLTNGASPFLGDLIIVSRIIGQETISDTLKLNVTNKTD